MGNWREEDLRNPKNRNVPIFRIFLIFLGLSYLFNNQLFPAEQILSDSSCPVQKRIEIVRGSSMEPLLKNGQEITALFGYYNCHPIQRNDVVLVKYAGNKNPLIKIIKGIPKDKFFLKKANQSGWHILINGKILKNSRGKNYLTGMHGYRMLSLYVKDYKGTIPEDAYLILGDNPSGSMDSAWFGLIGKSSVIAKAEYKAVSK